MLDNYEEYNYDKRVKIFLTLFIIYTNYNIKYHLAAIFYIGIMVP